MKTHILQIGLNDKDTKKQIYTTKQAINRIITQISRHNSITGYTITTAQGGYTHTDGTQVKENSIVLEITQNLPRATIKQLITDIKSADCLNQESILYTKRKANGVFI